MVNSKALLTRLNGAMPLPKATAGTTPGAFSMILQGLIDLMGGKQKFVAKLDSVWSLPPVFDDSYYGEVIHEIREMQIAGMGQYAHGNQPIQHMTYLYNYAGEPWKTQPMYAM
jgi:putative alpha-1,2-mannosidase